MSPGGKLRGPQTPLSGTLTAMEFPWMSAQLPTGGTFVQPLHDAALLQDDPLSGPPTHVFVPPHEPPGQSPDTPHEAPALLPP